MHVSSMINTSPPLILGFLVLEVFRNMKLHDILYIVTDLAIIKLKKNKESDM